MSLLFHWDMACRPLSNREGGEWFACESDLSSWKDNLLAHRAIYKRLECSERSISILPPLDWTTRMMGFFLTTKIELLSFSLPLLSHTHMVLGWLAGIASTLSQVCFAVVPRVKCLFFPLSFAVTVYYLLVPHTRTHTHINRKKEASIQHRRGETKARKPALTIPNISLDL